MVKVFVASVTKDQNVIKVDHQKLAQVGFKHLAHQAHEHGWTLVRLKGITNYSYRPSLVLKAVVYSLPL